MFKKALLAGGALALLVALVFGRSATSYISTTLGMARDSLRESIPINVDLQRARDEIQGLEPEIRKNIERIAKEEAQIKKLGDRVQRADGELAQMKSEILRLTNDLETNSSDYFVYVAEGREHSYSREHVKRDLKNRFAAYQSKDQEKSHYADILEARRETLYAAQEKLLAMRDAKSTLEVEVERLEAKFEMVNVAKAKSEFKVVDDSKLSRVRKLIDDIDTRIEVESRLADSGNEFPVRIPLDDESTSSEGITENVRDYFSSDDSELAKQ
jgi:chromosome segregation ATPase